MGVDRIKAIATFLLQKPRMTHWTEQAFFCAAVFAGEADIRIGDIQVPCSCGEGSAAQANMRREATEAGSGSPPASRRRLERKSSEGNETDRFRQIKSTENKEKRPVALQGFTKL